MSSGFGYPDISEPEPISGSAGCYFYWTTTPRECSSIKPKLDEAL